MKVEAAEELKEESKHPEEKDKIEEDKTKS